MGIYSRSKRIGARRKSKRRATKEEPVSTPVSRDSDDDDDVPLCVLATPSRNNTSINSVSSLKSRDPDDDDDVPLCVLATPSRNNTSINSVSSLKSRDPDDDDDVPLCVLATPSRNNTSINSVTSLKMTDPDDDDHDVDVPLCVLATPLRKNTSIDSVTSLKMSDPDDDGAPCRTIDSTLPAIAVNDALLSQLVPSIDSMTSVPELSNTHQDDIACSPELTLLQEYRTDETLASIENLDEPIRVPADWMIKHLTAGSVRLIKLADTTDVVLCKVIILVSKTEPYLNITVHQKEIPYPTHDIYSKYGRKPLSNVEINKMMEEIDSYGICIGNPDAEFQTSYPKTDKAHFESNFGEQYQSTVRSATCHLLFNAGPRCPRCSLLRNSLRATASRKRRATDNLELPSSHTPFTHLNKEQLRNRLEARSKENKNLRQHNRRLEKRVERMIHQQGVRLDLATSQDIQEIVKTTDQPFKENSFAALFWDQQMKAAKAKDSRSVRWHPMIIRWALNLRFKSGSAYDSLRSSGCLKLPSKRTLQDYTNVFQTRNGFQPEVFQMMIEERQLLNEADMYVTILQDEVKLQADLVFNKHTGELIGFVNLGATANQLYDFERAIIGDGPVMPEVATSMLVLMARGLTSNFKFAFGHFPCTGIRSEYLFPILWEAVERLEICDFKVLCITCDGATPNRKFFKLHKADGDTVIYKALNPWAEDGRFLYFISDAPHLIKTTRNCFSNSYSHKQSRNLWRNGCDISWRHIIDLYNVQFNQNLRLTPKITRSHVFLTSFATMKVSYATQVMSTTVARSLPLLVPGSEETVKFIQNIDTFFDCLNVRSLYEHEHKRKPFLAPYTSVNDFRFEWLTDVFLADLIAWKTEVENRLGDFDKGERARMLLSHQTLEGIEITARSFIEACQHLLHHGKPFVLSEKFNQDPLEQWFSLQRSAGGCNNNPTVNQFNYQTASLRKQKSSACAPFTGNCKRYQREIIVDNSRLPRRKRQR